MRGGARLDVEVMQSKVEKEAEGRAHEGRDREYQEKKGARSVAKHGVVENVDWTLQRNV